MKLSTFTVIFTSLLTILSGFAAIDNAMAQNPGANFNTSSPSNDFVPLPQTDTITGRVVMNLPGPGIVIVNASSWAIFDSNPAGVVCAITKGNKVNEGTQPIIVGQNHNETNARRMPITATRGFVETSKAKRRYKFVCYAQGDASLHDVIVTAIYVPRRYGPAPTATATGTEGAAENSSQD